MKPIVCFSLLTFLLLWSCNPVQLFELPDGDKISLYDSGIDIHDNGNLKKGKLTEDSEIKGFKCKNWVHFDREGNLLQFELSESSSLLGTDIPKGTVIFLNPDQEIIKMWPSKDILMNDLTCNGGGKIEVSFHRNGSLRCCFLTEDSEIQGHPVLASVFSPVCFHPNGRLNEFTLSDNHEINGISLYKGDTVYLDADGGIRLFDAEAE